MRAPSPPLALFAFTAAMQGSLAGAAFAQAGPTTHPPIPGVSPPAYYGPGWGPEAEPQPLEAPESEAPADLPVLYITSVEVLRTADPGVDLVRVTGLASSSGWSEPQLVPTYAGKPLDGILDLELIATPPEQSREADGFVPVSAILELREGAPIRGVRVRGSENALLATPGSALVRARVNADDCAHCVGRKLDLSGGAAPPRPGGIRLEHLPKPLRVLRSSDGIRDIEPDPNRLTLVLGEDNTIVEAFWE